LLRQGYRVIVYDLLIFGAAGLPKHPNLEVIAGDVRDTAHFRKCCDQVDYVIHLACIANDPSFELNPQLSKSINYDCFEPLVLAAKEARVSRFIYVSTSSVYGVSDAPEVTEEHPLVPLTDYNKYKGLCEPLLLKHEAPDFTTVIIRSATVCGYSPRMRLDLSVNILTNHAVNKGVITVFGGKQLRPNIHIQDITDLYVDLLTLPAALIAGQVFNVGYQNHSIADLARIVKEVVEQEMPERGEIEIRTAPTDDLRSYHVSSKKIAALLGYQPRRAIQDAVSEVCAAFCDGLLPNSFDDSSYYNVKKIKELALA
jgi:nucleoside-diphosphate-sugar epimerase